MCRLRSIEITEDSLAAEISFAGSRGSIQLSACGTLQHLPCSEGSPPALPVLLRIEMVSWTEFLPRLSSSALAALVQLHGLASPPYWVIDQFV